MSITAADILERAKNWDISQMRMTDGWPVRTAFWKMTSPPKHRVLMHPGRAECIEKRTLRAQEWADRGVQAYTFDWRGQAGSGRVLPREPMKCHINDFNTYLSDLHEIWERLWLPGKHIQGRNIIEGHSLGSHLLLRYMSEHPDTPGADNMIIEAPLISIKTDPIPPVIAYPIAQFLGTAIGTHWAKGQKPSSARAQAKARFEGNPYTADPEYYAWRQELMHLRPELAIGGVTWSWAAAALRSHRALISKLSNIKTPTLALITPNDPEIDGGSQGALQQLKNCQVVEFANSRHELFMGPPELRQREWATIDRYLHL